MTEKKKKAEKKLKKVTKFCEKTMDTLNADGGLENEIPEALLLAPDSHAGFFFGTAADRAIGVQQGREGNILVIGGNGSGKSACIAMPTLETWREPMLVLDIKGELSARYAKLHDEGRVSRPYIILDFEDPESIAYDPLAWLALDKKENLSRNIRDLALAIIPNQPEAKEPFWVESEQALLSAALLFYYHVGLGFSESICRIAASNVKDLCAEISESDDLLVKMFLGEISDMGKRQMNEIGRGVRNKILPFATDAYISHIFRGKREGAKCLKWSDLEKMNIFLHVPEHKIEQWRSAIIFMLTQLIRYFESRPEKYSEEGRRKSQILLLLDEFARFGKLEPISDAMATLRSKKVTICLIVQSLAQLERFYGQCERKIIADNCQYKLILGAMDTETQQYISNLIGTCERKKFSVNLGAGEEPKMDNCSISVVTARAPVIFPHELATLKEVLVVSPYGFCRVKKNLAADLACRRQTLIEKKKIREAYIEQIGISVYRRNDGAKMLTIKERFENANKKANEFSHNARLEQRQARENQKKRAQRINFIVGEMVTQHFPHLLDIEPGANEEENAIRFRALDEVLTELQRDPKFSQMIENIAASDQKQGE